MTEHVLCVTSRHQSYVTCTITNVRRIATLSLGSLWLFLSCASSDPEPLACCRIRLICTHCTCPAGSVDIYMKNNNAACQAWLDDPDYADGCESYRGSEAIAECAK